MKEVKDKSSGMLRGIPLTHSKFGNKDTSGIVINVDKNTKSVQTKAERP